MGRQLHSDDDALCLCAPLLQLSLTELAAACSIVPCQRESDVCCGPTCHLVNGCSGSQPPIQGEDSQALHGVSCSTGLSGMANLAQ